jgi:CubicO group peptidase (beta-lactamase class C family)
MDVQGFADRGRSRAWQPGSLVQPYSVSKPFAAVCALLLVQAGRLDLDALEAALRDCLGLPTVS